MKRWLSILGFVLMSAPGLATGSPVPVTLPCDNSSQSLFVASLESTDLVGQVGEVAIVKIQWEPELDTLPFGYFIVSLAETTFAPDGPQAEILTGSHEIQVVPRVADDYQFRVRVNLVTKSSCGGAEANTLLKETVRMTVVPE